MPDTFILRDWQSFYLLTGTAAATLIGLIFLAISLGARLVPAEATPAMRAFVNPTVIHFGAVLVLSGLMLVPTYTLPILGLTVMLAGLAGLVYLVGVARQMRLHHRQEQALDARHWLWHTLMPAASYGLTLATGLGLLLGYGWALSVLPLAALGLIITGLRNAFDLLLWIARQTA